MAPPVFIEGPKFLKKQDLTGSKTLKIIEKICEKCLSRYKSDQWTFRWGLVGGKKYPVPLVMGTLPRPCTSIYYVNEI